MSEQTSETQPTEVTPPKSSNKLVLILGVMLGITSGTAGFFFWKANTTATHTKTEKSDHETESGAEKPLSKEEQLKELASICNVNLPEMIVNLRNNKTGAASLLKTTLILELKNEEDQKVIDALKARIVDAFQTHMRELDVSQIEGAAGLERLRHALLERANTIAKPTIIQRVIIKEFLSQ